MKKEFKNLKVFAESQEGMAGYNIYVSFSGMREFVAWHRRNGMLYEILKDGIDYNELKRMNFRARGGAFKYKAKQKNKQKTNYCEKSVKYLLNVVDDYLEYAV